MTEARSYFLPYQERWIDDDSTFKIAEKSRRVGFTYASSYRMFKKCMTRGADFKQFVSSRTLDLAQEFIRDYIQKWCKLGNVVAEGMYGDNVVVVDPEKNITAFQCVFPTGARIISLSSKPEAFAGRGGDVFLDEADLHEHSDDLIDMATPCIMWGNQLEIVSAYRVDGTKDTPFAKLVADAKKDNPQHASLHRVTIHDAVAQGLVEKINEATGRNRSREEFLKEMRALVRTQAAWESQFECKVQDAGGKLLKTANYAACELPPEEIAAIEAAHPNARASPGTTSPATSTRARTTSTSSSASRSTSSTARPSTTCLSTPRRSSSGGRCAVARSRSPDLRWTPPASACRWPRRWRRSSRAASTR